MNNKRRKEKNMEVFWKVTACQLATSFHWLISDGLQLDGQL
jgi:hypothetical protein